MDRQVSQEVEEQIELLERGEASISSGEIGDEDTLLMKADDDLDDAEDDACLFLSSSLTFKDESESVPDNFELREDSQISQHDDLNSDDQIVQGEGVGYREDLYQDEKPEEVLNEDEYREGSHQDERKGSGNEANVNFVFEEEIEDHEEEEIGDGDTSTISEFRGSLGLDYIETPWETDIQREVEIQLGEESWATKLNQVEGGLSPESWESKLMNIAKRSDIDLEVWSSTLREIAENQGLHALWDTNIAEQFINKEIPGNWKTKLRPIEKVDQKKNTWKTKFNNIKDRLTAKDIWSTKFNSIFTKKDMRKDWQFEMPKKMKNPNENTDWGSKFNKIQENTGVEMWDSTFREMLLRCDDRQSHWGSKFQEIEKSCEELNPWSTAFKQIAPSEEEKEVWNSTFRAISEETDLPEHWRTKFINMNNTMNEHEWLVKMEDVPDNFRQDSDWGTAFNSIENSELNLMWNTLFNEIVENAEDSDWASKLESADLSGIERDSWEMDKNPIMPNTSGEEWEMSMNVLDKGEGNWEGEANDEDIERYLDRN